jgi:hypothetical protein
MLPALVPAGAGAGGMWAKHNLNEPTHRHTGYRIPYGV